MARFKQIPHLAKLKARNPGLAGDDDTCRSSAVTAGERLPLATDALAQGQINDSACCAQAEAFGVTEIAPVSRCKATAPAPSPITGDTLPEQCSDGGKQDTTYGGVRPERRGHCSGSPTTKPRRTYRRRRIGEFIETCMPGEGDGDGQKADKR